MGEQGVPGMGEHGVPCRHGRARSTWMGELLGFEYLGKGAWSTSSVPTAVTAMPIAVTGIPTMG